MTEPAAPSRASTGLIVVLAGLSAFAPLSIDMYLPALPRLTRDLHAPEASGSFTVAAFFLGLCLGQLIQGPISDRLGRRPPLIAGIALYVAAMLGAAFAQTLEQMVALRFVQALGGCAGLVIARAVVRDRFTPQESAHVFSAMLLVMSLAPIIAPLIGSGVLAVAGWRAIFVGLAGFGTIVLAATVLRLPETRHADTAAHARGETPLAAYRALLRERRVMGYAVAGGASHAGLLTYLASTPDVLIGGYGIAPTAMGALIAINGVGLVAANWVNRRLLARHGYRAILLRANGASLIAAALLLGCGLTGLGGLWGIVVPLFAIVGLVGFTQPNAFAGTMAHDPRRAGSASAIVGALQFGCGAAGASLASLFHDGTAVPMAIVILCGYAIAFASLRLVRD